MIKDLYKLLDKLELIVTKGFFDDIAKEIELKNAIKMLRNIIKLNEDNLK